jgi:hypothetical protein
MRRILSIAAVTLAALSLPAGAGAADRVYFGTGSTISYVNLDGSGGGDLDTGAATVSPVRGIALDPAAGRIYWANSSPANKISYANLDGSGGADLTVTGAAVNWPTGLAVDPAAGRIYWGDYQGGATERISYASLDGSAGGQVVTSGATAGNITGIALDPAAGRIYWSNENGPISYANLGGSGGDDINLTGASVGSRFSEGVAIDPDTQQIYWTSHLVFSPYDPLISHAALDESGGSDLATPGATLDFPAGVAIDPEGGRAYWANTAANSGPGSISFAALDGSGGADLNMSGATNFGANLPALLKAPVGAGAPRIDPQLGVRPRSLICHSGSWTGDVPEAQLYRAPHTTSLEWLRDGRPVAAVTKEPLYVDGSPGTYACRETATNEAGSTSQTSLTVEVCCRRSPLAQVARVALVKHRRALLRMRCPADARCAGVLSLRSRSRRPGGGKAMTFGIAHFSVPAKGRRTVPVRLRKGALSILHRARRHRFKARLSGSGVADRTVLLKLARKRRHARR